jgi:hypothetical protein
VEEEKGGWEDPPSPPHPPLILYEGERARGMLGPHASTNKYHYILSLLLVLVLILALDLVMVLIVALEFWYFSLSWL